MKHETVVLCEYCYLLLFVFHRSLMDYFPDLLHLPWKNSFLLVVVITLIYFQKFKPFSGLKTIYPKPQQLLTIKQIKLFKGEGAYPIMRGNAFVVNERSAFLWTIGYVPKTQTTLSLEVPNPIFIEINKGNADIEQVLKDIMALTKLNYNACIYADGIPVTLRFADKIGEILTASTDIQAPPLAFKYYI